MDDVQKVIRALHNVTDKRVGKLYLYFQAKGKELERDMKEQASWTDRTGNARKGLRSGGFVTDSEVGIYTAHTMWYGEGLEKEHEGRYAILKPTLDKYLPDLRKEIEKVWSGK